MSEESKESPGKKKDKKKVQLPDLSPDETEVTEDEAGNVKGGDSPPPDPFPTQSSGS
jgi:hypothetical protein